MGPVYWLWSLPQWGINGPTAVYPFDSMNNKYKGQKSHFGWGQVLESSPHSFPGQILSQEANTG